MAPKKNTGSALAAAATADSFRAALEQLVAKGKNTAEPVTLGELLAAAAEQE